MDGTTAGAEPSSPEEVGTGNASQQAISTEESSGKEQLVGAIDYALLIDATGSMAAVIEAAKDYAYENTMGMKVRSSSPDEFRAGCVCFRDPVDCPGDENAIFNFTDNVPELQRFLSGQQAQGGGDYAEDWSGGLRMAVDKLRWREESTKLIVVIGDAPGHGLYHDRHYESERPKIVSVLKDIASRGIRLGFIEIQMGRGESATTAAMNEAAQIYLANGGIACNVDAIEFEHNPSFMPIPHPPEAMPAMARRAPPRFGMRPPIGAAMGAPPAGGGMMGAGMFGGGYYGGMGAGMPPPAMAAESAPPYDPSEAHHESYLSRSSAPIGRQISFTSNRLIGSHGYSSIRTPAMNFTDPGSEYYPSDPTYVPPSSSSSSHPPHPYPHPSSSSDSDSDSYQPS